MPYYGSLEPDGDVCLIQERYNNRVYLATTSHLFQMYKQAHTTQNYIHINKVSLIVDIPDDFGTKL